MKSVSEIGPKITLAQREFYRYTGTSAALERRGAGTSRPDLAWGQRQKQEETRNLPSFMPDDKKPSIF
jgi:hypothetical protein